MIFSWLRPLFTLFPMFLFVALKPHNSAKKIIIPRLVNEKGDFITYKIPYHFKRIFHNTTNNTALHYKVKIKDEELLLELEPNMDVLSSGSVQEKCNGTSSIVDYLNQTNLKLFNDLQCQYRGRVKHKPGSIVALSNCAGLMGYIKVNNEFFMIEPIERTPNPNTGQPHLVYQHNFSPQVFRPNLLPTNVRSRNSSQENQHRWVRKAGPGYMKQMYLETLVVLDKTLIDFHQSLDLDNYILTVLNMAHTLFRDGTFGAPLELVVVRMISLEREDDEMNLRLTKDAPKVLEVFKAWANRINPPLDSHPNHHDIAILITRVDICLKGDAGCGLLGLASLASVCDAEEQALLVEDTGLAVGFTVAHEIGHALGMWHDGLDESGCEAAHADGYGVVMAKTVSASTRGWSSCSREYLWAFIDAGLASCLYDEPSDYQATSPEVLPGAVYGVSFQCQSLVDHTASECPDVGVECDNMKCWLAEYGCVATHRPLAEGTACGERAWCLGGRCLAAGQRPAARDGGWSEWGGWSACSRSCGGGVRHSARSCDEPRPENGGYYCRGQRVKYEVCSTQACPFEATPYRDMQCAEFNSWLYPEDNKTHSWKSYISTSEKPCALVCLSESGQLALLRPAATDGTPCYSGRGHLCVAGQCKSVGCDGKLDSGEVEDACGVCSGGGTSCELRVGQRAFKRLAKLQLILDVPVKTLFASFEETSPTKAKFFIKSGKTTIVSGNKFGISNFKNMKIWVGYVRDQQELLRITGPVTEALQVYVQASEAVTVKYSVGSVSAGRPGVYSWQLAGWSDCSAPCGVGDQYTIAQCVETTNGIVDDKYCPASERPKVQTRVCELTKCEPRWQVGEWSGCDCACAADLMDERAVLCARGGGAEGGDHVVDDAHCLPPKPISQRPCKCPPHARSDRTLQANVTSKQIGSQFKNTLQSVKEKLKTVTRAAKMKSKNMKNSHASLTKIIDRDHLKNVKSIQELKGKLIQDYENINEFELVLEIDKESAGKNGAPFSKHHNNKNKVTVHGLEAVKIIQKVQESHHKDSKSSLNSYYLF